jgi:hypothetical protein
MLGMHGMLVPVTGESQDISIKTDRIDAFPGICVWKYWYALRKPLKVKNRTPSFMHTQLVIPGPRGAQTEEAGPRCYTNPTIMTRIAIVKCGYPPQDLFVLPATPDLCSVQ